MYLLNHNLVIHVTDIFIVPCSVIPNCLNTDSEGFNSILVVKISVAKCRTENIIIQLPL